MTRQDDKLDLQLIGTSLGPYQIMIITSFTSTNVKLRFRFDIHLTFT